MFRFRRCAPALTMASGGCLSSVLQSRNTVFLKRVSHVAISITHFLTGCYRIRNDEGQRGKTGDEFSTLWKTISRFFHAMEDPAHAGPHCGKRGSRSVDLPVRASSSSVARLLLLGADQRSTLRGAPSPFSYNPYDCPSTGLVPVCLRLCSHTSCPANLTIPGASPGDFPNPAQSC